MIKVKHEPNSMFGKQSVSVEDIKNNTLEIYCTYFDQIHGRSKTIYDTLYSPSK